MPRPFLIQLLFLLLLFAVAGASPKVHVITVDATINPATADYTHESIRAAQEANAQCLVIRLNTPGGLLKSTRVIVTDLLASPIPVVVYVAPSGSQSASAGTFITLAAHIAAMAPGTNLGAATPVQIGSPVPGLPGITPDKDGKDKKDSAQQTEPKDAMMAKATNDAVGFIRSLAELRGRNADWAEKAVREAASLSAGAAVQAKVIDLEARDRWFAQAIVTSPAMFRRNAGAGSLYWLSAMDSSGAYLDGGKNYRLTIPQPVPGKLFWSVTVYDSATRSQVQTD